MKKATLYLLVVALLLSLAAGCGSNTQEGSESGDGSGEELTSLVIGQAADVSALDPQLTSAIASVSVYGNMFDTLTRIDEEGNVVPHIAESWEQIDENTISFKIREDVTFSNGEPLTSEDVAFTIERVVASPYVAYVLDFVDSVETPDEYTVVVHTNEAFGPILAHFSIPYTGIVPKSEVEKDEAAFSAHPIGSGAYKLVEWKPGDYVTLEANDNYFLGAPTIKEVTFRIMPENSQRFIALEAGEIDIAYDIAPNDVKRAEESDELQVINQESMSAMYLTINMGKGGPLADPNVRKAISLAINRQDIIDAVSYGYGSLASSVVPPSCICYSDNVAPTEYNLEQAKEYMAQSDYPDGFSCTLWTSDDSIRVEASNIIQAQLAELNIDVKLEILEYGTLLSSLDHGDHDLVYERWTTDSGDAYYTIYALYNSTCTPYEGNDAFYVNETVDQLIQEGRQIFDVAERTAVFEQIYEIVAEDLPYVPIYYPYNSVAMSNQVQGFVLNPNGAHQINNISLAG